MNNIFRQVLFYPKLCLCALVPTGLLYTWSQLFEAGYWPLKHHKENLSFVTAKYLVFIFYRSTVNCESCTYTIDARVGRKKSLS